MPTPFSAIHKSLKTNIPSIDTVEDVEDGLEVVVGSIRERRVSDRNPFPCSVTDSQRFRHLKILSSYHLTDLYLVGLAQEYRGCLATFDRGIPTGALADFRSESLKVL